MEAKVVIAFRGMPDGGTQVQAYQPGDIITGDLARAMVEAGYARVPQTEKADTPERNKAKKSAPRNKSGS